MSRRVVIAGAVAGVLALSGCSQAGLTVEDAYKVGCPALDAVAAGFPTRLLAGLCAGVAPETTRAALEAMLAAGVTVA